MENLKFDFFISDIRILSLNLSTHRHRVTEIDVVDPLAANAILAPEQRTYDGLEQRLQYLTDSHLSLLDFKAQQDAGIPIVFQSQHNLRLKIS